MGPILTSGVCVECLRVRLMASSIHGDEPVLPLDNPKGKICQTATIELTKRSAGWFIEFNQRGESIKFHKFVAVPGCQVCNIEKRYG